jgi:NADPH:quinone reductase-like Zn-dependent oxidoreductase
MKPQVIFNKVVRHLFKQNKKCVSEDGTCVYRGPNNTKCAVGALIPNHLYNEEMETKGISNLIRKNEKIADLLDKTNVDLLSSLQEMHDDAVLTVKNTFNKRMLKKKLEYVAKNNNLSTKVLNEV